MTSFQILPIVSGKIHFKYLIALFTFEILFFIAFWAYFYSGKILPGIYLGDVNYSGLERETAGELVQRQLSLFDNSTLTFFVSDGDTKTKIQLTAKQLGVNFDSEATLDNLYKEGRSDGLLRYVLFSFKSFFRNQTVEPTYFVDGNKFSSSLNLAFSNFFTKPTDASVVFKNNSFEIEPERMGKTYNRENLISKLRYDVANLSSFPIDVEFVDIEPEIKSENATLALSKLQTLQKQKINLLWEGDSWSLAGNNLISILEFSSGSEDIVFDLGAEPVVLKSVKTYGNITPVLDVTLNQVALEKFIGKIGNSIDVSTVDANFVFEGDKISQFTPAVDGKKLDREKLKQLILAKISIDNVSGEGELVINLPVVVTKAKFENEQINSMGISELLAKGVSYFGGSIPNRIFNLTLGSKRINGTLVKPGDTFSFNRAVGEVSGATGYKPAYVISSGRTVLDDGGGICQVSTTIFRAALAAGLPIVSRTAHAYRVGYYEQRGFKPGLDATVWSPAVDLSFKNDTDHHILVQTIVDNVNAKLEVAIYGTKDGRRVELSGPVVSNLTPAPEPKYQDDPTLPKGTTKQVDFAAGGATSVFTRKVYRGDDLILDDIFKSNYRPWQAVYLVGTGG